MASEIIKKLKRIERQEAALARAKKALLDQEKQAKAAASELEALVKKSSFGTPKALVEALVSHFDLRISSKKRGRPSAQKTRRARTKITAELRDKIKAELAKGATATSISQSYEISYPVVSNIKNGKYDKLK
jgi:DNA repair exonuclease SbcCD ATPase subunit